MSAPPRDLPPDLNARFRVHARFAGGEGWTGLVTEAAHPERQVLLKVLDGPLRPGEVSVLASLDHPCIPRVLETGTLADGTAFLVREFVPGEPLQASFPLAPAAAVACAAQILEVLAYVHLRGVLHLDLKPANVVRASGETGPRLHLLDFGLARRGAGHSAGGTPFFAAPEVLLGLPASARSDLFSLGALLVAALHGAGAIPLGPFMASFPRVDFFTAAGLDPTALPAPFDRVLPRLLARRPEERCADAQEALALLTGGSGRPSVTVLDLDPIAAFGDALTATLRAAGARDVEIVGGDAGGRRALALHAACEAGDVVRIEDGADACRLVRGGTPAHRWWVPDLEPAAIAAHLGSAVGLDAPTAVATAKVLADSGVTTPAGLGRALRELLAAGRIIPQGPHWLWPDAAAGRIRLGGDSVPASGPADLTTLAARGLAERAQAEYERLRAAAPAREPELRAALAAGFLQGGEPGRALPLVHDAPALRARALLDVGRVAEAQAIVAGLPETGNAGLRAAIAAAGGDAARAQALYAGLGAGAGVDARIALGGILAGTGDLERARVELRAALDAVGGERPFLRAAALTNLAEVERRAGDLQQALTLHGEALRLLQAMGQVRYTAQVSSNLGVVAKDLGHLDEAREHLRRAGALFEHVGDARGAALAEANLGIASLEAGDADLAVRRLDAALATFERLGHREWLPLLRAFLARALAGSGALERARELIATAAKSSDERVQREVSRARAILHDADTRPGPRPMNPTVPDPSAEGFISRGVFRSFLAVNRRLASEARLDRAMEYLLEAAIALAGARTGLLLVVRRDGVRLELRAGDAPPAGYAFSRSLVHRAIQERRALTGDEALADRGLMEMPSVRGLQVKSVLCVPFVSASGTEGALYVEHSGRPGAFGALEKEYLEVLADQAAIAVDRMVQAEQLAAELEHSKRDLEVVRRSGRRERVARIVGESAPMRAVLEQVRKLAPNDLAVLVLGETGTGKELVARAIHAQSKVAKGPFVSVNCAAIAPDLLESELFGHTKGAFTGADDDRVGLMELASGGTLFLDEIGDMPAPMQASLLRALQEGRVRPVGSSETRPVSVRVVAATHRDLRAMIATGAFRQDLYYRIAGAEIVLPALRERDDDVTLLAEAMLVELGRQHARTVQLSPRARRQLRAYRWPGNVRELEHVLARAVILGEGDTIDDLDLPAEVGEVDGRPVTSGPWPAITLKEAEERTIRAALTTTGGDKSAAAKLLGVSRTALYAKLKRMDEG